MGIPGAGGAGMSGSGQGSGSGSGTGGQGQGRGGRPPENENAVSDFERNRLRARGISPGRIVAIEHVRGLPPGEHKPKTEYTEAVEAVESSEESIRERERIPREDRELIRDYHNRLKGIPSQN